MKRHTIRLLIIFAVVSVLGILAIQTYWFRQAFSTESERFHREVNTALFNVASRLFAMNNIPQPNVNPIEQLSTNYYAVMINDQIEPSLLEMLLRDEFARRDIRANFEYGIYDCTNEKMVYGNYVRMNDKTGEETRAGMLPLWENQPYYFGVHFPDRDSLILNRMGIWLFSSAVLAVVVIFFGYAVFIILRQRRLSAIQKEFINNMTHEFKTPLSTISLSSEVLKNPGIAHAPARLHQYAEIIETESNRLRDQVERILDMARVDKEDYELNPEPLNLNDVILRSATDAGMMLKEYDGMLCLDLSEENPVINGDRLHVSNVILNLLDNAFKYCRKSPRVTISTRKTGKVVHLTVEDNGIGLKPGEQKKVFHKFYRVPTGNVHDVKGFGLGLAYVRSVMEKHRGSVNLVSVPDRGSVVTLKFSHA